MLTFLDLSTISTFLRLPDVLHKMHACSSGLRHLLNRHLLLHMSYYGVQDAPLFVLFVSSQTNASLVVEFVHLTRACVFVSSLLQENP